MKIITLLNKKDGYGKTTIGLNLAYLFSAKYKKKTGFMDLNSGIYDSEGHLLLNKKYNFNADGNVYDYYMEREKFFLFWVEPGKFREAIRKIHKEIEILFVDTEGIPEEIVLDVSDHIIIPSEISHLSIKNSRYVLDYLKLNKYPASITSVVVNKYKPGVLSADDIKEFFAKKEIPLMLPDDNGVKRSAEKRFIYGIKNGGSEFVSVLTSLSDKLIKQRESKDHLSILGSHRKPDVVILPDKEKDDLKVCGKKESIIVKKQVRELLFREINVRDMEKDALTHPEKREKIFCTMKEKIREILDNIKCAATERKEREALVDEIFNEVAGLGAIESLLKDSDVTEIMVNRYDEIYTERSGKIYRSDKIFTDNESVLRVIERIVMPLGRRIDESVPYVDARLVDGSRVNAIIPPLAIDGPVLTIRKFSDKKLSADDLIGFGSLTEEMAGYLKNAVLNRKNIVVSGGTGSGKTTLLNVLSSFISEDQRIITVEDSAELRLAQDHVIRLESRPSNIEGKGRVTIRDLVKNCLRMRPDRIVVGECRGAEALDMLQAMNTGHDGSMTTVHANSPRDAISRIEVMVLMAGADLPLRAIREQIKSAINVIVQQARMKDGSRKVTRIAELTGMEGDTILMHNVFE